MKRIFVFLISIVFIIGFVGCDNILQPPVDEPVDEPDLVLYPSIVWLNEPSEIQMSSRGITSAPSDFSFFDFTGLNFSATFETETGEFAFTDGSITDGVFNSYIVVSTGIISGSLSFFSAHTVEIDMLWKSTDTDYYEETYSINYNDTTGWETVFESVSSNLIEETGTLDDPDYTIAFKEIRFISDDFTNYFTWTNPDL